MFSCYLSEIHYILYGNLQGILRVYFLGIPSANARHDRTGKAPCTSGLGGLGALVFLGVAYKATLNLLRNVSDVASVLATPPKTIMHRARKQVIPSHPKSENNVSKSSLLAVSRGFV